MKWMIASDVHGSAYYCKKLLEAFRAEGADRLVLLGDILYHGPRNDLPREYDPKQVTSMLNSCRDKILCVRGNCDAEVDQMVLEFPVLAEYALLDLGERLVYATATSTARTACRRCGPGMCCCAAIPMCLPAGRSRGSGI